MKNKNKNNFLFKPKQSQEIAEITGTLFNDIFRPRKLRSSEARIPIFRPHQDILKAGGKGKAQMLRFVELMFLALYKQYSAFGLPKELFQELYEFFLEAYDVKKFEKAFMSEFDDKDFSLDAEDDILDPVNFRTPFAKSRKDHHVKWRLQVGVYNGGVWHGLVADAYHDEEYKPVTGKKQSISLSLLGHKLIGEQESMNIGQRAPSLLERDFETTVSFNLSRIVEKLVMSLELKKIIREQ